MNSVRRNDAVCGCSLPEFLTRICGWIDEGEAVVANYSYAYVLQKQNQLAHWAVAKR